MRPDYTVHRTPSFKVLSEDQLHEIHLAVLEVLERTGIEVHHEEARELLAKAGCRVDGTRVRYPVGLVEECMESATSRVTICDHEGNRAMFLESNKIHFGMGSDTVYACDPFTHKIKKSEAVDAANAARVADSLENIDFLMSLGIVHDVPHTVNDLVHFQQMVENSTKPICFTAHHRKNLQHIIDMASAVVGDFKALLATSYTGVAISTSLHLLQKLPKGINIFVQKLGHLLFIPPDHGFHNFQMIRGLLQAWKFGIQKDLNRGPPEDVMRLLDHLIEKSVSRKLNKGQVQV